MYFIVMEVRGVGRVRFLASSHSGHVIPQCCHVPAPQNIFPLGVTIHERYDLKGSWVNRSSNVGSNAVKKQCRCGVSSRTVIERLFDDDGCASVHWFIVARPRHCNAEYRKGMGMCEVGPTTQHDFDVVWKDLDFKIKVCPAVVSPLPTVASIGGPLLHFGCAL
jgi:hypothetical protein